MSKSTEPKKVVFVHPDLGIGGAERLVIDAAVGLQSLGHKITILTSYCNPNHCFEEARDGTLDVRVRGDKIFPTALAGRFSILFTILRQISLVLSTALFSSELKTLAPDVIFVDQLSICVPFFRVLYPKARILFYGHYPDRLLVKQESGITQQLKQVYRIPFDLLEGWSTGCADAIFVNSKFTRNVYRHTFPDFRRRDVKVIYPCVDTESAKPKDEGNTVWADKKVLLSINRFEGKKNLALAIQAYAALSKEERSKARLILAGGYDPRNAENAACHKELQVLAESLDLTHATFKPHDTALTDMSTDDVDVLFLLSIPNELKVRLLNSASLLIYTPKDEHFGIVPLEAGLAGIPVLATNTGGPLETIYDGRTGWLRSPEKVEQWTEVMRKPLIPSSAETLKSMGQKGRERVLADFSQTKMSQAFDYEIRQLLESKKRPHVLPDWLYALLYMLGVSIIATVLVMKVMWYALDYAETAHLANLAEKNASSIVEAVTSSVTSARNEL